ncbi:MAG: HAD family hydrolase [Opitutales bacterium]
MAQQHYVFDLGNVLFAFDYHRAWRKVAAGSSLCEEELARRAGINDHLHAYERGHVATESFFEWMSEHLAFRDGARALQSIWTEIFEPLHERLHVMRELALHYPVHALSNTNDAHITYLETSYPEVFERFTHRIYSHRVGAMKPQAEIYEALETAAACSPGQLFFFDDRPDNIEAALARGWQGRCIQPDEFLDHCLYAK